MLAMEDHKSHVNNSKAFPQSIANSTIEMRMKIGGEKCFQLNSLIYD